MRRKLTIAFIGLVALSWTSTLLSACNTVEGAGKDVSSAGKAITDDAKDHKK